jgi:CDP-6-deoxy-D-xylo-4-hexulose-3-dehydrase
LFDFKIHGSLPKASTVDESSLFFGNHHYCLDVDFDCLAEILRGAIGDVKKLEGALP